MPEAINGGRYACQKCVNGHRTKTCQHWENEHDNLAKSVDLAELAPGASPQDIAVFAKTRSAGRPKAADLEKEKKGMTLYVLLKTNVDGKESCTAVGEIDIDADGNKKVTRKTGKCCKGGQITSSPPPNLPRVKSGSETPMPKKRSLDADVGDVSYETTRKNAKHECSCGSTCKCRFCPQHPNTKATQDVMRQVAEKVKEERQSKPDGQIEFHQTFPDVVHCGGGHFTGANSQIFATDDLDQLELWRQQDDGTGNFLATIPLDFSTPFGQGDQGYSSPETLASPQNLHFPSSSASPIQQSQTVFHPSFTQPEDFKISSPQDSPSSIDQFIALNTMANMTTPAVSSQNSIPLNMQVQVQDMYSHGQSPFENKPKPSCCQASAPVSPRNDPIHKQAANFAMGPPRHTPVFTNRSPPQTNMFNSQILGNHHQHLDQNGPSQSVQRGCCGGPVQPMQPQQASLVQHAYRPQGFNGHVQHCSVSTFPHNPSPGMMVRHNSFPTYNPHANTYIGPSHAEIGPNYFPAVPDHIHQPQQMFAGHHPGHFDSQYWHEATNAPPSANGQMPFPA